jgi:hypothetical protein
MAGRVTEKRTRDVSGQALRHANLDVEDIERNIVLVALEHFLVQRLGPVCAAKLDSTRSATLQIILRAKRVDRPAVLNGAVHFAGTGKDTQSPAACG